MKVPVEVEEQTETDALKPDVIHMWELTGVQHCFIFLGMYTHLYRTGNVFIYSYKKTKQKKHWVASTTASWSLKYAKTDIVYRYF